jgi:hypothetical protein
VGCSRGLRSTTQILAETGSQAPSSLLRIAGMRGSRLAFVRLRTGQLQQLHELRGGISLDHDAAGESERDGRPDGDLYGDRLRHRAVELPVAEGRCDHRGSNRRELHHRAQFASWEAG